MSAILQRPKRITSESVSDESREAVEFVGAAVNTFMEEVYIAVMGNLGTESNLNREFKTLTIEVDADGIPKRNISFQTGLKTKIQGMQVIRTFLARPIAAPFVGFDENAGVVKITYVLGLAPDTKYQLVIESIGS